MAGPTVTLTFAGDSKNLEQTFDKVGSSADGMVKTFSGKSAALVAAGAGAGAGLASAFTNSLDFEDAKAKLSAQLGGGEYAAEAGKIAGEVYAGAYGDSLGQVNDAVRSVMQSGALMEGASSEQIQSITENALSLSDAFGVDVSDAMTGVGQVMKNGLAPDAQTALDVITRGFQTGVDKSGDFLDTLNEYSSQFKSLGLDAATATGLMSQGLQGGARDADTVADALKEFNLLAQDTGSTAADGFKKLGLDGKQMADDIAAGGDRAKGALDKTLDGLRNITDPVKQNSAAVDLFGTKAEDLQGALFALDPSTATDALGQVGGAAQNVNDTLSDTASNKIEGVKRGFQEWSDQIVGMDGPIGGLAAGIFGMGSDALGLAGSLGMAAVALQSLNLWSKIATISQWLWNAAMSANPIGLIVLAIAGLVAGLIWAYNNIGWFKDGVNAAFSFIKTAIGVAVDWIVDKWNGAIAFFRGIPAFFSRVFTAAGDGIKNAFRAAFNFVADIWNNTVGRIGFTVPSWVPVVGGNSFSVPKIPKMHTGGVVPGAPGSEMLAMLQAGERVVPADRSGGSGGMTVNFGGNVDGAFATAFRRLVREGQIELVPA